MVDNQDVEEHAPRRVSGLLWATLVVSVSSSCFLYAFDNTVIANIRPSIILSLGEINKLSWISVAYALGEVSSNPFW